MKSSAAALMTFRDFRSVFDRTPDPLLIVATENLKIQAANQRARALLGYGPGELEGLTLHNLLQPVDLDRVVALVPVLLAGKEVQGCQVRDQKNKLRDADINLARSGIEGSFIVSIHDGSSRAKLEEQLRQAHKMEAVGMLAGGIAHDFNNLLTIISGYSQMLMGSAYLTTERDRTAIEQVLKASERAAELTSQLLAFSRRQTIQPKVIEINKVLDQTTMMLRRLIGEHIDLRMHSAPDAGSIHADAGQIQQVIMNLAINSRDAMPDGGILIIETRQVQLGNEYASDPLAIKPGNYVMLAVSDTGTGMDPATRKRIFEPFFTTKAQGKGTGLGLSTVYGIVKQSGGTINIYTEPGQGTTIKVYFPRLESTATDEPQERDEVKGGHETVLLVEDEEGVRKMVRAALERQGYNVLVAASGPEALNLARSYDGPIDLLVTDMVMPQMSGRELGRRLLNERPELAILFISGYTGTTLQNTGALQTEATFLQKPFAPPVLTRKVREILDGRERGRESASHRG